jgi:hypothetical protein
MTGAFVFVNFILLCALLYRTGKIIRRLDRMDSPVVVGEPSGRGY